jgi:small conductance mechanosensitive channel
MAEDLVAAVPRVAAGLVVLVVGWLAVGLAVRVLRRRLTARRDHSFAQVFGGLAKGALLAVLALVVAAVVFPSVNPASLFAGLGVLSIAASFAFQDILQNLLAGALLLIRRPFEEGDQIDVDGKNGTVELINLRETQLRTFDGQRYVIPNTDVYQAAVLVHTAFPSRRTSVLVGVDYDADLDQACQVALDALSMVDGVQADPAPQAYLVEFGDSAMVIDLRYWTEAHQAEVRRVQHRAIVAVKRAYDRAGIDIPFPIRTLDARAGFGEALQRADGERVGAGVNG